MKILVLTDKYPPFFEGGYELACQDDSRELASRGHDVTIVTTTYGVKGGGGASQEERFPVIRGLLSGDSGDFLLDFCNFYWRSQVVRFYIARRNYHITKKIIKEFKPNIVYAFQLIEATFTPIIAAYKASVPVIANVADDSYAKIIMSFRQENVTVKGLFRLFRRMLAFGMFRMRPSTIAHFFSNSERTNNVLFDAGVARAQCSIFPHYLRNEDFSWSSSEMLAPKTEMSKHLKIVYGGRLCREKGIEMLVEIISRCRQRGVSEKIQVDLFGNGDTAYVELVLSLMQDNGLDGVISIYPGMEQRAFLNRLTDYHIFLFPFQWEEPFGKVVTQSMASGVVCIASDKGGPAEIITHLRTGCLCRQNSVDDFVGNIELLVSDQDCFDAIRRQAFQEARKKYSANVVVPKIEQLLQQFSLTPEY